jgi:fucose 4-O-acetylase-like acetyltransferase
MKVPLFNSQKVLSTSRYPWIDYVRGISIILVVYRHVFEGLANVGIGSVSYPVLKYTNIFFFSFRMPLFFIVSGMFVTLSLSRKGLRTYITKRFDTIFYPLLIWGTIHITLQLIFAKYINAQRTPFDYLNLIINPRQIEQFWYLNALFFVGILYALVKTKFNIPAWKQVLLGVVLFSASTLLYQQHIQIGFLFDVMFFYMFFAIGDLIADYILNTKNYRFLTSPWTLLAITPVFFVVQYFFTEINLEHKDDYFVQYQVPLLYAVSALIGASFIISLSFNLERLNVLRFLRVVGFHSLYIYVMHLMITAFTRVFFVRIIGTTDIPVIMITSILAGIIIPIMFYNTATRLGATWLFTLRPEIKPIAPAAKAEPIVSVSRFSKQEPTHEILENITTRNR